VKASSGIRRICQRHDIDVVQFMENYGPAMLLMPLVGMRVPSSALVGGYYPCLPAYSVMLKLWDRIFTRIVPSTEAIRQKLLQIGLREERVSERIGWGIDASRMRRAVRIREEIRAQLGIDPHSTLVLWSGFLQRTSFREFQYSIEVAQRALSLSDSCSFIFCFKQVHFKREFLRYAQDRLVIISAESNEEFLKLVNASDIFLSPYLAKSSILTPPLTWLECMAYEIPIIATDNTGVGEVITSGYNGYIVHSKEEMAKCILNLIENKERLRTMGANAREFVCQNYNIAQVATKFLCLWQGMKA
jgi:glycosyltransferase involved in cell wall biosynthesis